MPWCYSHGLELLPKPSTSHVSYLAILLCLCKKNLRNFPGGPVVNTPCFHCFGHRFNPRSGNMTPHAMQDGQKTKKAKTKNNLFPFIKICHTFFGRNMFKLFPKKIPKYKGYKVLLKCWAISLNKWYGFHLIEFQIVFVIIRWRKLQAYLYLGYSKPLWNQ